MGTHALANGAHKGVTDESCLQVDDFLLFFWQGLLIDVVLMDRGGKLWKVLSGIALTSDEEVSSSIFGVLLEDERSDKVKHFV